MRVESVFVSIDGVPVVRIIGIRNTPPLPAKVAGRPAENLGNRRGVYFHTISGGFLVLFGTPFW